MYSVNPSALPDLHLWDNSTHIGDRHNHPLRQGITRTRAIDLAVCNAQASREIGG